MHLISIRNLRLDSSTYSDTQTVIEEWYKVVKSASWQNLEEVKQIYRDTEAVGNFTVFNIKGNRYRLIVDVNYVNQTIYYKYFLTHAEYDKDSWKMTITFDRKVYINLLADFVPEVITSEVEYDRALAIAERLVANRNLSNEESKFLSLIVTLIEDYESNHYPMGDVSPHAALLHLIEYSGTCQKDLVGSIGSDEVVTDIISGKRPIDSIQAKALGEYFQVSASLFI
jgi:mRNA-degrading endonuclease HigB of HigAB toxin-antitoxin module/antitoxin component HigA of HigAB toxin-antitoxin module